MLFVPRRARILLEKDSHVAESAIQPLESYRASSAWVLLGEPGLGKSKAFEQEADAIGGVCISISKFLSDEPDAAWQGKTLFLDGLDETRASGGDTAILLRVRAHLKKIGGPPFRIACRAADWFGSTDRDAISDVSPDKQLLVLCLEPLNRDEILLILKENHGIAETEDFVEMAEQHGLSGLLDNPQTLNLLAESIRDKRWPETRQEIYLFACEKLAGEGAKAHRNRQRGQGGPTTEALLNAAGQLCAVMLLADQNGLALDPETADERFPFIESYLPADLNAARLSVASKLFRAGGDGEERLMPSHRSVAEYLAARWLAAQIDEHGLPLGRVLNLLLGNDERTVSGLRGLYGWLAFHCQAARQRLIDADPLTVIVYGDVKSMSTGDKRRLLQGLRREASLNVAFLWDVRSDKAFAALSDPALIDDFRTLFESPERSDSSQSYTACVLDILVEGEVIPALAGELKALIVDETRWKHVRELALRAWLKASPPPEQAIALLDAINDARIADPDDQMAGLLLQTLYPEHITAEQLLSYLHSPKARELTGSYSWFWEHELPEIAPVEHLPILLDRLALRDDLPLSGSNEFHLRRMVSSLLISGLQSCGDRIDDKRLFVWLGIGADNYGSIDRNKSDKAKIASWIENRPERFKGLMKLSFDQCRGSENPIYCQSKGEQRLHDAAPPHDIGRWHLEQAGQESDDALAELHLSSALCALTWHRGDEGLSLEMFEEWAELNPERGSWLAKLLFCETPEWREENAKRETSYKNKVAETRRARTNELSKQLAQIRSGKAAVGLLHELAGVWLDHYTDTHGDTPLARFESYCDIASDVLAAAEEGFVRCVERDDLPSIGEIIRLDIKQRQHLIRQPCLVGMELRWRRDPRQVYLLSDENLRCMLAFRLTYGADSAPAWFDDLVRKRPALVAGVFVDYASSALKSRQGFVSGTYSLAHDPGYRSVALLAVPALLERFPVRCKSTQLSHLEYLLKSALTYAMPELSRIIEIKLAAKSMDSASRVYWLSTGMLLNPKKYEEHLWNYIGNSWTRANTLCGFVSDKFSGLLTDYQLSARSIGRMIEMLTPHAELDQRSGFVSAAMHRGDSVRALISRLGSLATNAAEQEIARLLASPGLKKLRHYLDNARYKSKMRRREALFRFPQLSSVATILANKQPTSASDLAVLVVDHLDDIAREIRQDNSDLFRSFWTEASTNGPKPENSCRDVLLNLLRVRLVTFGIDCQPEADQFNDKRADIRVSFRNEFALPIEIKREDNPSMWTALRSQLIGQYTISPQAAGHGIYLVLWFGGGRLAAAKDGGNKPISPEELQVRLAAQLDQEEQKRIFVRVFNVSWPCESR